MRGPSLPFHLCRGAGGIRETGEIDAGLADKAAASSSSRASVKDHRRRTSSEKGARLEADGFTDAEERAEVGGGAGRHSVFMSWIFTDRLLPLISSTRWQNCHILDQSCSLRPRF